MSYPKTADRLFNIGAHNTIVFNATTTLRRERTGLAPSPEQLYGIEINDYAHELAQATVWIGYLQWLHDIGFVSEPILKPLDNIEHMDAILAYDAQGKPVEPEWPEVDVIVGNPPFFAKELTENQGITFMGTIKVGPFELDASPAAQMLSADLNENG